MYGAYAQIVPCNIQFTVSSQPGATQVVTLTNNSTFTTIPGSNPSMWIQWGDNITQSISHTNGLSFNHTYASAGNYIITVGATHYDSINSVLVCSSTDTQLISVAALPCSTSITKVNNGGGSYTFTANNIGGGTGISYTWNFGDGSPTVSGSPVTHTYTTTGNYTVHVTSTSASCQSGASTTVQHFNGTLNCAQLNATFTTLGTGFTRNFANNSTPTNNIPGASIIKVGHWNFGDGGTAVSSTYLTPHTYASTGTYLVKLVNNWVDSNTNVVYCTDSFTQTITITTPPPPPNVISGYILWDSTIAPVMNQASFKVWLITFDANTNMLTAVDSQTVSGYFAAPYSFSGYPAGTYRTKAAVLAGTPAAGTLMPTYHDSSLFWNTALQIAHTGASSTNKNIKMKTGINTGGPGFIGGNVTQGANKGTGAGVPNLLVALLNTSFKIVDFTYTDANGNYSFASVPLGDYIVYPESMNYTTTPSSAINLTSGQLVVNGIDFKHTPTDIKPIPAGINDLPNSDLFTVYPNPSKGNVQINWTSTMTGKVNISVVDITGREVMTQEAKTSGATTINLGHLQNGIYFIKVAGNNAQHTEKIVLQH